MQEDSSATQTGTSFAPKLKTNTYSITTVCKFLLNGIPSGDRK